MYVKRTQGRKDSGTEVPHRYGGLKSPIALRFWRFEKIAPMAAAGK